MNLKLYNQVREVPKEAQKEIKGGRLNGKTDINPMWRIKELTNQFGPCGIGWTYEITKQWLETGSNDQIAAFVNIELQVCVDDKWSQPIPGTGGSMFVAKETNGYHTSDECFKMALTDAISVSCKALGFGADVYWDKDKTKYDLTNNAITKKQQEELFAVSKGKEEQAKAVLAKYGYAMSKDIQQDHFSEICEEIRRATNVK